MSWFVTHRLAVRVVANAAISTGEVENSAFLTLQVLAPFCANSAKGDTVRPSLVFQTCCNGGTLIPVLQISS
jgi:hypothetical protein